MRKLEIVGVLVVLAGFALLLGTNLDVSPGLHGDEAWFGLRAQQMMSGEARSIHGMTAHSGALFPLLVAGSFKVFGMSVWSLRVPGAVCNVVAIGLLTWLVWNVQRRAGSAILLLLLLAGSVLVTAESRVAWEVTALGPLLAAALLALALRILRRADSARGRGGGRHGVRGDRHARHLQPPDLPGARRRALRLEPRVCRPLPGVPNAFAAVRDDGRPRHRGGAGVREDEALRARPVRPGIGPALRVRDRTSGRGVPGSSPPARRTARKRCWRGSPGR